MTLPALVTRTVVDGDHPVEVRVESSAADVRLVVTALDRPELAFRVHVRTQGEPVCTANEPSRWTMCRGLPRAYNERDPFWLATRWAHAWMFPGAPDPSDPDRRGRCMRAVYAACRVAAIDAADACLPGPRRAAMRFLPHVRWFAYRHIARDTTGRVAQLAACCPGAVMFAYALDEHGVHTDDGPAADVLLSDVVAGRPLRAVLTRAVAAWAAAIHTRCPLGEHNDRVWAELRDGERDLAAVARAQKLLVQRASHRVPTTLLWLPPPEQFAPEDMPAATRARAAWYRAVKTATIVAVHRLAPAERARFAGFVSAHGAALVTAARRRNLAISGLLVEILDAARADDRIPCRQSSLPRVLADAAAWHAAILRESGDAESAALDLPFPPAPLAEWNAGDFHAIALQNPRALFAEGDRMRHCLASRVDDAREGRAAYYAVTHGRRRATLEIRPNEHGWTVTETSGVANNELPVKTTVAVSRFVAALNRALRQPAAPPGHLCARSMHDPGRPLPTEPHGRPAP